MSFTVLTLIVAQVTAEWVEISQQHYRKPIRAHSYNPFTTSEIRVEDTTKIWNYKNGSVSEYNWSKHREPNAGNVKRIHYSGSVKPTDAVKGEDYELESDEFEIRPNHGLIKPSDNTKQKGTIEKVPNIGNVKRVQLSNTPVKSPVINIDKEKIPKSRYEELPIDNKQQAIQLFEDRKSTENKPDIRRIYVNKMSSAEATSKFPVEDEFIEKVQVIKKHPIPAIKNRTNVKNVFSPKLTFVTEEEDSIQHETSEDRLHIASQSPTQGINKKQHIHTTDVSVIPEKDKESEEIKFTKHTNKNTNDKGLVKHESVNELIQKEHENVGKFTNNEQVEHKTDNNDKMELNSKPRNEIYNNEKYTQDKQKIISTKSKEPEDKVKNMESLLKLMKVVADTISQNTRRSFGGKIRYLKDLKDSILGNIAERIDATWPDDNGAGARRRSRSAHATPRGHHVAFPSSEGALMTISFLTFAVFLIKLVLQVIHTYKNKAMMVAPVMVAAAGRASSQ